MREASTTKRIDALDLARGIALLAMAIFHFAWDLEFFGYVPPGMTQEIGWKLFARSIASTFLFLVGVSLYLAHHRGVQWAPFLKRFLQIAAAALLITLTTLYATPDRFIFFGILHQIAFASLFGLFFLRLPALMLLLLGAAFIVLREFLRTPAFDSPLLWWIGIAPLDPPSNDYVPLFPWFGAVLLGIGSAKVAQSVGFFGWLAPRRAGRWAQPIRFAGRHGLAFYLLHQPMLIGAIWLFSLIAPPHQTSPLALWGESCRSSCLPFAEEAWCQAYCGCVSDELARGGMLDEVLSQRSDAEVEETTGSIAAACQSRLGSEMNEQ